MLLRYLLLILLFCTSTLQAAETDVIGVNYAYQGKHHHVFGRKIAGVYYFNENATKTIKLATSNWPPYIGERLCDKGWVFQLAVALFTSQGYQVQIEFLPWARAIRTVESGEADLLFPEYFIEPTAPSDNFIGKYRHDLLALSDSFPGGLVRFFKRRGSTDKFVGNLDNLAGESIGVVRGYQNTPEFDAMMDRGHFNILTVMNELQQIKVLAAGRVNLIIADPIALEYAIKSSHLNAERQQALSNSIQAVMPALSYNPLHFAVSKRHPEWQTILNQLNLTMRTFLQSGETKRIITNKNCH